MTRLHGTPYNEGERFYGPPRGFFDPEWVVRMARDRRPSISFALAYRLAEHAWRHMRACPQLSVDELADYCAVDEIDACNDDVVTVVECAVDFCEAFGVEPPR